MEKLKYATSLTCFHCHYTLRMVGIYKLLKLKNVPNADTLEKLNTKRQHPCVYLSPVGNDAIPDSGSDSFQACVVC